MEPAPGSPRSADYEESSRSGSSAAKYSSDSFESTPDEPSCDYDSDSFESFKSERSPIYGSDTFESFSQVNSHEVSLSESTSSTSEAFEEVLSRNDTENGLIEKWITKLAQRKLQSANSLRPQLSSVAQPNYTETESSSLQSYCSMKIQHLCAQPTITRERKPRSGQHRSSIKRHPSCNIPSVIMNRLQMQRVKETIKQVTQAKFHDPSSCPDCIHKQAELAQSQFVRMRRTKMQEDLLKLKLEEYTYQNDLVTRIGEIHQSLPKPSDDRNAIWQRLYAGVKT